MITKTQERAMEEVIAREVGGFETRATKFDVVRSFQKNALPTVLERARNGRISGVHCIMEMDDFDMMLRVEIFAYKEPDPAMVVFRACRLDDPKNARFVKAWKSNTPPQWIPDPVWKNMAIPCLFKGDKFDAILFPSDPVAQEAMIRKAEPIAKCFLSDDDMQMWYEEVEKTPALVMSAQVEFLLFYSCGERRGVFSPRTVVEGGTRKIDEVAKATAHPVKEEENGNT